MHVGGWLTLASTFCLHLQSCLCWVITVVCGFCRIHHLHALLQVMFVMGQQQRVQRTLGQHVNNNAEFQKIVTQALAGQ